MFIIDDRPTFRREVTVHVPDGDGTRKETIKATYRVIPSSEIDAAKFTTGEGTKEFLRTAIVTLDDLVDKAKQTVAYDDKVRDLVLDLPYVRVALCNTYLDEVSKATEGN